MSYDLYLLRMPADATEEEIGDFVVYDPQGPNVVDLAAGPDGEGGEGGNGGDAKPTEAKPSRWRF